MADKTKFEIYVDSNVAAGATDVQASDIIPATATVRILSFGGFDPNIGDSKDGIIGLQYGSGTNWKTLRAGGGGVFDFNSKIDIVGDGTKRFRLVRKNNSSTPKSLICWLYAVIL